MSRVEDDEAHQVVAVESDPHGRPVYSSLCGQVAAPDGWDPAEPGVVRCQECQSMVAGSPD